MKVGIESKKHLFRAIPLGADFSLQVEIDDTTTDIRTMEYFISPVIIFLILRYGFPTVVTWFFERFVVSKVEYAKGKSRAPTFEAKLSYTRRIDAARKDLHDLRHRLKKD